MQKDIGKSMQNILHDNIIAIMFYDLTNLLLKIMNFLWENLKNFLFSAIQ